MSHFASVKTQLVSQAALVAALQKLGFSTIETHETAQPLYGYQGDRRAQTAEVIIRRQYVGSASNDLGFKRTEEGPYLAIISAYDRHRYNTDWLQTLQLEHDKAYVQIEYPPHLWDYTETIEADGSIQLTLTKRIDLCTDSVSAGGW